MQQGLQTDVKKDIVFPVPETVKTPWFGSTGELPTTLEYFNGSIY